MTEVETETERKPSPQMLCVDMIDVASYVGDVDTLHGDIRRLEVRYARCAAAYLSRELLGKSIADLGRAFRRDRTTAANMLARADQMIARNTRAFIDLVEAVRVEALYWDLEPWRNGRRYRPSQPVNLGSCAIYRTAEELEEHVGLARRGRLLEEGDDCSRVCSPEWWAINDARFVAAMRAAHPERDLLRSSILEAAE